MIQSLVSIVVPVYNVEQYLRECVDSILAQTYKNIEVILVDDGSLDGSSAICDEYANKDPRIIVIHKTNGGLSDARNAGIEIANGDFINFCDSDDKILPDMIEVLLSLMGKKGTEIVSCESFLWDSAGVKIIEHYHRSKPITEFTPETFIHGYFLGTCDCSVCNKLFKRSIIGDIRFIKGKTNEDILFLYDVIKKTNIVIHTNKGFYQYRVNQESITHRFSPTTIDVVLNAITLKEKIKRDFPNILLLKDVQTFIYKNSYNILRTMQVKGLKNNGSFALSYSLLRHELISMLPYLFIFNPIAFVKTCRAIFL